MFQDFFHPHPCRYNQPIRYWLFQWEAETERSTDFRADIINVSPVETNYRLIITIKMSKKISVIHLMWLRHDMHFYDSIIKCLVEAAKRQRQKREPLNDNDEGEKRYLFSFSLDWGNSMSSTKEKKKDEKHLGCCFFPGSQKKVCIIVCMSRSERRFGPFSVWLFKFIPC